MTETFPAARYTETVLAVNFADAQKHFLDALMDLHFAHGVMLAEQGMLTRDEVRAVLSGLRRIDRTALATATYDGSVEDFFFHVERELTRVCDPQAAAKLHTARSRNDIDITLYRMRIREELLLVHRAIAEAARVLLDLASRHLDTVMPAHTHTQPAQPTTLAHYLCAAIECFARDLPRLEAAYKTVNVNPLGACAITTTGFPIDRHRTAELLGFEGLQVNSYGAIAAVDYIAESAAAVMTSLLTLGKLVQDLLTWSTVEYGFLRLSDGYVQCSSIMPQKRNPVALEHTRILASRGLGEAQGLFTAMHNTPFGDIVDSEDDLQPLIFLMFEDARRAWSLVGPALRGATFDAARLRERAGQHFLTVTELADTLVREEGISFHDAHKLVSIAVNADRNDHRHERLADCVIDNAAGVLGRALHTPRAKLIEALDPDYFVKIRRIPGGPAPEAVQAQLDTLNAAVDRANEWRASKQALLQEYRTKLEFAVEGLSGK
jgi:argininosuccinate lyase